MLPGLVSQLRNTSRRDPADTETFLYRDRRSRLILVVDDDALVRTALHDFLQQAGYQVLCAAGGSAALQLCLPHSQTPHIDMVVTDFAMPGMNGLELAVSLTADSRQIPVLILSGSFPQDLPLDRIERSGWHYLPKPIRRDTLLPLIDRECLEAHRAINRLGKSLVTGEVLQG